MLSPNLLIILTLIQNGHRGRKLNRNRSYRRYVLWVTRPRDSLQLHLHAMLRHRLPADQVLVMRDHDLQEVHQPKSLAQVQMLQKMRLKVIQDSLGVHQARKAYSRQHKIQMPK